VSCKYSAFAYITSFFGRYGCPIHIIGSNAFFQSPGGGNAGSLTEDNAVRDDVGGVVCLRGGGIAAAGDEKVLALGTMFAEANLWEAENLYQAGLLERPSEELFRKIGSIR
jgi:hypothetical protein